MTANCLHPGFVATRFGDQTGGLISFGIRIGKRFALSAQGGAEALIYLASSPAVDSVTGEYFDKCCPVVPPGKHKMTLQLSSFGLKLPDSRTWISKRSENPSDRASASRCIYVTGSCGSWRPKITCLGTC